MDNFKITQEEYIEVAFGELNEFCAFSPSVTGMAFHNEFIDPDVSQRMLVFYMDENCPVGFFYGMDHSYLNIKYRDKFNKFKDKLKARMSDNNG